jgi:hypothetical protein
MQTIRSLVPRKPRKRPAPSQRDQDIYVEYQITGRRQTELAEKHKLTQTRVSQIIRRVAAWRANSDPRDEGDLTQVERQRLDRWLEHERLNFICREAMHHFCQQQKLIAHKHGQRDDKTFDETTERLLPPNLQCLKILLAANAQLSKLEQKPPLSSRDPDEQQRRFILFEELRRLREAAEREGKVTHSYDIEDAWLKALVGEANDGRRPNPAARELSQAILPECEREAGAGCRAAARIDSESHWGDQHDCIAEPVASAEVPPGGWDLPAAADMQDAHETAGSSTYDDPPALPQPAAEQPLVVSGPVEEIPKSTPAVGGRRHAKPRQRVLTREEIERQWNSPPPPALLAPGQRPTTQFEDPKERRRRHFLRLEDMRRARRRGLPQTFTFYPEDGPMPRDPPYVLDGAPPPTGCDPAHPGTMSSPESF